MAVSDDEFDTSVAGITGCAAGKAPPIGGGTLVWKNSAPSTGAVRAPVTAGTSASIWLFSSKRPEALASASGPAWTTSCSKLSAALDAAARAAASADDAGGRSWGGG